MTARITPWAIVACAALELSAGCVSPAPEYFTLAQAQPSLPQNTQSGAPIFIEVVAVRVPERLNRSQMLVSGSDGTMTLLEHAQWSANFPDELRDAVSNYLQQRVNARDMYHQSLSGKTPQYRVTMAVVRLEVDSNGHTNAVVNWNVQQVGDKSIRSGETEVNLETAPGVQGMVAAYRQVVVATGNDIAGVLGAMFQADSAATQ